MPHPQESTGTARVASSASRGTIGGSRNLASNAPTTRPTKAVPPLTIGSKAVAASLKSSIRSTRADGQNQIVSSAPATRTATVKPAKATGGDAIHASSSSGRLKPRQPAKGKVVASTSTPSLSHNRTATDPAHLARADIGVQPSAPDTLQLAAQLHAWDYMLCTLEGRLEAFQQSADVELRVMSEKLSAQENDIADSRVRLDSERLLNFYDELSDSDMATLPATIQNFLLHEEDCSHAMSRALSYLSRPLDENTDICDCNDILNQLDILQVKAVRIESSILVISGGVSPPPGSRIVSALRALVQILDARKETLSSARSAIHAHKENLRIVLQIQSEKG